MTPGGAQGVVHGATLAAAAAASAVGSVVGAAAAQTLPTPAGFSYQYGPLECGYLGLPVRRQMTAVGGVLLAGLGSCEEYGVNATAHQPVSQNQGRLVGVDGALFCSTPGSVNFCSGFASRIHA